MSQSGRAATKVPEPRMEHGLNTERESALMALEKEEITEKIWVKMSPRGEGGLIAEVGGNGAVRRLERLARGNGKGSASAFTTRLQGLPLHGGSSLPINRLVRQSTVHPSRISQLNS